MSITNAANLLPQMDTDHHAHVVQFYSEDRFLLDELSHFIGTALAAGSSAVVIATKGHEDNLSQRLKGQGPIFRKLLRAADTWLWMPRRPLPD